MFNHVSNKIVCDRKYMGNIKKYLFSSKIKTKTTLYYIDQKVN